MPDSTTYPNLVDRALRFLEQSGRATAPDLCAHLFGVRGAAATVGPWAKLLDECLRSDRRFAVLPDGRWALRDRPGEANALRELEFVALAIGATGPKPWRHRVVGIAAVRCSGRRASGPDELWVSAIRPSAARHLPSYLRELDLTIEEIESAPTFADAADDLLAFLGERPLLGMDVGLAVAFLQFELRRLGRPPLSNSLIELAALADLVGAGAGQDSKPELARIARAADVPIGDERRLRSRSRTAGLAGAVLLGRAEAAGIARLSELVAATNRLSNAARTGIEATRRHLLLDVAAQRDLPDGPGVYLLRDRDGQVLYVGKATSLQRRVASYLTTDLARSRRMSGVVEATAEISAEPTETELEAQLLEARLIAEHHPRFNVQRKSRLGLTYVRRNLAAGLPRIKGAPRRPPWASLTARPGDDSLGPVLVEEARRLMREAVDRFRLRRRRNKPDWAARADEAWRWLATAADETALPGGLLVADLDGFALRAPWPLGPPAQSQADGDGRDEEADWPPRPPMEDEIGTDAEVETEGRGALVESSAPAAEPEAIRDDVRLVVVSRHGWAGSLTLPAALGEADAAARAVAATRGDSSSRATALVELAVALRWAARHSEAILRLRPSARDHPDSTPASARLG